jgi:hypothetical protein
MFVWRGRLHQNEHVHGNSSPLLPRLEGTRGEQEAPGEGGGYETQIRVARRASHNRGGLLDSAWGYYSSGSYDSTMSDSEGWCHSQRKQLQAVSDLCSHDTGHISARDLRIDVRLLQRHD